MVTLICLRQVHGLKKVFQEKFGFQVEEKPISGKRRCKPKFEVAKAILDLIHSDEHDRTLFIIYYAGHGFISHNRPNEVDEFKLAALVSGSAGLIFRLHIS